jgi:hypothetical protein
MNQLQQRQVAEKLAAELAASGDAFRLLHRHSPESVHIQFTGLFQQQPVVWDAIIQTLGHYFKHTVKDKLEPGQSVYLKQFIEIKPGVNLLQLQIALNLAEIDDAAIKRSIIMIRNYKRLHVGRHEYGDAHRYSSG